MFTTKSDGNWREDDFRWIADWGFDFVRLPMCYLLWTEGDDAFAIRESGLEKVDRAVRLGQQHGLHVCLNFHRGPGYSVNREREEPFDLWKDQAALDAFCFHWETLARRYRGISYHQISFNLLNEPATEAATGMTRADHERVMRAAVAAIRAIDPDRLIILDGISWGNEPCPELADLAAGNEGSPSGPGDAIGSAPLLGEQASERSFASLRMTKGGVAQSCRAYLPMGISHYKANWVRSEDWPEPTWPGARHHDEPWDRARLEQHYQRWADLAARGIGVHCGEGGAFNQTPHAAFLAWFRDVLEILTAQGIGYALWNFRGAFGLLDSGRPDVAYDDWHGHKLDRQLLALLQEF
jgi:endoglucanase